MTNDNKSPQDQAPEAQDQAEVEAGAAEATADDLELMLEDARAKADEHWNQVLRLQAEMENNRRRHEKDVENAHKFALERFVQELLPVKDSLELGLAAVVEGGDESVEKLREGTELTLKMLAGAMEKNGVTEVNPMGEAFNPEYHQAMTMQESGEYPPNTVINVMQKGYLLNERLIRPAMVVVSKGPSAESGNEVDTQA